MVSWSLFPKIAVSGEDFETSVLCGTLNYIFLSNLFLVIFPEWIPLWDVSDVKQLSWTEDVALIFSGIFKMPTMASER